MAERSKYFMAAIASSIGGLVLLALGCVFCCGGCLPMQDRIQIEPRPPAEDVEAIKPRP
jgi:hypothetical protein